MSQTLIPSAQNFYRDLAANNTKPWWDANRHTYDDMLRPAALTLLADLTPAISTLADAPIKSKLFRPHRDVRFSKDKTPYKTHLHMMWMLDTPARQNPVFFFGIGTDTVTIGTGIMSFDKPMLADWRHFADLDHKRILAIMDGIANHGLQLRDPTLKRVPPAYPADHPAGHLLRMKGCVATKTITSTDDILQGFQDAAPLTALLLQIAEA